MSYSLPYFIAQDNNMSVIDFKQGDVNGDNIIDNIILVGEKTSDIEFPFTTNITLIIQDGKTKNFTKIPLKENAGYHPTIFLGDFTGDKIEDILISIDSGGSGGYAFYYVYTFINNTPKVIFDSEKYSKKYTYTVNYLDNYEVKVVDEVSSQSYIIDIRYKGDEYLSEIYNADGILKEPIEGWVNPLGGLYPVDFQRDGTYELYALRRIAGRYNADGLGDVQTALEWKNNDFIPLFQTVGIYG